MFGLSPSKLLFTVLIIAAVWYGFKWIGRFQANQKKQSPNQDGAAKGNTPTSNDGVEDLVACSKCGDYVISDKKSGCGKDGCPYER